MTIDRIGNVSKISKRILTFLTLQLPVLILRKKSLQVYRKIQNMYQVEVNLHIF